jgi:hypothetical protein
LAEWQLSLIRMGWRGKKERLLLALMPVLMVPDNVRVVAPDHPQSDRYRHHRSLPQPEYSHIALHGLQQASIRDSLSCLWVFDLLGVTS